MIREVEGMIRTWKIHLEEKYKIQIEADNPIFPWIVRFAGEVITRFKKGPDGLTPYERLKEKKPRTRGALIGEKIMFMLLKDSGNNKDKLDERYDEGIWVGTNNADGASIVMTMDGIKMARSIRRVPDPEVRCDIFIFSIRYAMGNGRF